MFYRSFAFAAMMMACAPVEAQTTAPTIGTLKQMVSDLGYKTYGDDKTYVAVDGMTAAGGTVFFALENDGATLDIYKPFDTPTAEQMQNIPSAAMLKFNNEHAFYFTIGEAEEKDRVVLQEMFDASIISPVFLRKQIDTLRATVDEGKALWDVEQWGQASAANDKATASTAGPGTPEAFQIQIAKADAIWERTPFQLRNVMFVTEKAPVVGAYKPRGSNVFKSDETLRIYVEPFGYAWQTTPDAMNRFDIKIDFELMDGDKIIMGQKNAETFSATSRVKLTAFMANLYLNVKGLEPGKYTMRWIFHDTIADKRAVASLPFELTK